jgi:hypothetical protein
VNAWDGMHVVEGRDIARSFDLDLEGERAEQERTRRAEERESLRAAAEAKARGRWRPRAQAIRLFLEGGVNLYGFTLEEALSAVRRGGPVTNADRRRYDVLACEVYALRSRSRPWFAITLRDIGAVLGKGPQTISNLEARGRELSTPKPPPPPVACRMHESFMQDCPACLRQNAERA